jgi:hypothetical protein
MGKDPTENILKSETEMKLKYFTLTETILSYSEDIKVKKFQEQINVKSIFNKLKDDLKSGKCCSNVSYRQYALCLNGKCPESNIAGVPNEVGSNYCLEIKAEGQVYIYRICHDRETVMKRFQNKLKINIIASNYGGVNKIPKNIFEKLIFSSDISDDNATDGNYSKFTWEEQTQWGGYCQEGSLPQSPIDIVTVLAKDNPITVNYQFDKSQTSIQKNSVEIKASFKNNAGVFSYEVGGKSINYQVESLSFRFPGEHTIDGRRYPGEVLIHMGELNANTVIFVHK